MAGKGIFLWKTKGFRWFNVIHARNYMQTYINLETNELHWVHTNKMEGKWGLFKMHFCSGNARGMYEALKTVSFSRLYNATESVFRFILQATVYSMDGNSDPAGVGDEDNATESRMVESNTCLCLTFYDTAHAHANIFV